MYDVNMCGSCHLSLHDSVLLPPRRWLAHACIHPDTYLCIYTHHNPYTYTHAPTHTPLPISKHKHSTLDFSYEVAWVKTDKSFENRFDRYLDYECVFFIRKGGYVCMYMLLPSLMCIYI